MSLLALSSHFPAGLSAALAHPNPTAAGIRREDPIRENVELALAGIHHERNYCERRRETRYPYPYPVHLTPVERDGTADLAQTVVVLGKHLSEHGLDFYHREPLPHRRVIASLPNGENRWLAFLLDLTWCRFSRHGWYDNGGRFLAVVPSPL